MQNQPFASITASYSRKMSLASFTGNVGRDDTDRFENIDFFCSLNHAWFDKEPTRKEIRDMYDSLYELCKKNVEASVEEARVKFRPTPLNASPTDTPW